jgi:hypothetical protein
MTDRPGAVHGGGSEPVPKESRRIAWLTRLETTLLLIAPIGIWHGNVGYALAISLLWIAIAKRDYRLLDRKVLVYTAGYLLLMLALAALSTNPAAAAKGSLRFASGFLMLLPGITVGRHLREHGIQAQALLPTSALMAAYFMSPAYFEGRLFFGFRGNPNGTGFSLLFTLLVLGLAAASLPPTPWKPGEGKATRLLLGVNLTAASALLLISNHRGGWLGAICFSAIIATRRCNTSKLRQILAGLATLALFAGVVLAFDRKITLTSMDSIGIRLSLWSTAIETTVKNHLFFGSGFNTFQDVIGVHEYKDSLRAYRHPHNLLVDLFFSTGMAGLTATAAYIMSQARIVKRLKIPLSQPIALASAAAIASLLVALFFDRSIGRFTETGSISFLYGVLLAQAPLQANTATNSGTVA